MPDWRLETVGCVPWPELAERVPPEITWLWIGLDGLGVGQLPADEPIGTHLWGWSTGAWIRARLDRGVARVARLVDTGDVGEPVTVFADQGLPWDDNESQLSKAGRASMSKFREPDSLFFLLTAGITNPITFLHYGSHPAPGLE